MTGRLLITSIPVFTLADVSAALQDGIHWFDRLPVTQEQALDHAKALIGLRQAQWHVESALHGPEHMPATYLKDAGNDKVDNRGGRRNRR